MAMDSGSRNKSMMRAMAPGVVLLALIAGCKGGAKDQAAAGADAAKAARAIPVEFQYPPSYIAWALSTAALTSFSFN